MQTVRWLGFCVSQSMSRSLLHFFPSCENASAPYPATCTLTLLAGEGSGQNNAVQPHAIQRNGPDARGAQLDAAPPVRAVVALEGGRLGHPDGLRLEDAFPTLRTEVSGLFGIQVEISTPQPRLDVGSSGCVLEVISQSQPVRFVPKKLLGKESSNGRDAGRRGKWADSRTKAPASGATQMSVVAQEQRSSVSMSSVSGMAILDGQQAPSLVFVNASNKPISAAVFSLTSRGREPGAEGEDLPVASIQLAAGQTRELPLQDGAFASATSHEFLSGRCQSLPFCVELRDESLSKEGGSENEGSSGESVASVEASQVGIFLVHREARTKRLASVVTLESADF